MMLLALCDAGASVSPDQKRHVAIHFDYIYRGIQYEVVPLGKLKPLAPPGQP